MSVKFLLFITFLLPSIAMANHHDLGFREGHHFVKTNFVGDAIQYGLVDTLTQIEIELTLKDKPECLISIEEQLHDSPAQLNLREDHKALLKKDLEFLPLMSGYSYFDNPRDFLAVFKVYLKAKLPLECINIPNFEIN